MKRHTKRHYAALGTDWGSVLIFKGKTTLRAVAKAKEWVFANSEASRHGHELEKGKVTDEEWLKIMEEIGFEVTPAELGKNA